MPLRLFWEENEVMGKEDNSAISSDRPIFSINKTGHQ